jgi:hypothetical protein
MSKAMIKFSRGHYNIRGEATDVGGLEFPITEDYKMGKDGFGYVTVDGSFQPGFPTRNIRIKCEQGDYSVVPGHDPGSQGRHRASNDRDGTSGRGQEFWR